MRRVPLMWDYIGLFTLAAVLRVWQPGLYQLVWDEVNLLFTSQQLGLYGEWVWLSNQTSFSILPGHSPFNNYVLALPYLLTAEPQAARVLIGLMGALSVVVLYDAVRVPYGRAAGFITGLFFAVAVNAVEWSRFVWNPNIAPLFTALWLWTGLRVIQRRRYRLLVFHWLMLSFAGQAHLSNIILGVVSVWIVWAVWRAEKSRAPIIWTGVGWGLAALTLIPWGVGIWRAWQTTVNTEPTMPMTTETLSAQLLVDKFVNVVAAPFYNMVVRTQDPAAGWFPPLIIDRLLWGLGVMLMAGAVGVLVYGFRTGLRRTTAPTHNPLTRLPTQMLAALALLPLLYIPLVPIDVQGFYMMALLYGALPLAAVLLAAFGGYVGDVTVPGQFRAIRRVVMWGVVGVFCVSSLWMLVGQYGWLRSGAWQQPLRASLDTLTTYPDQWLAQGEVVVLVEEPTDKYVLPDMQARFWSVVVGDKPVRIVSTWFGGGVPLAADTPTLVVGLKEGQTIPTLFGVGSLSGRMYDGEAVFREILLDEFLLDVNFVPETIQQFDNGARIVGGYAEDMPVPGEVWDMTLVWQPQTATMDDTYQFSVRLVGEDGTRYAQHDFTSLAGGLWRPGDTVYNRVRLNVSEALPLAIIPRIEILMYVLDTGVNANAIDDNGGVVAPWLILTPR